MEGVNKLVHKNNFFFIVKETENKKQCIRLGYRMLHNISTYFKDWIFFCVDILIFLGLIFFTCDWTCVCCVLLTIFSSSSPEHTQHNTRLREDGRGRCCCCCCSCYHRETNDDAPLFLEDEHTDRRPGRSFSSFYPMTQTTRRCCCLLLAHPPPAHPHNAHSHLKTTTK